MRYSLLFTLLLLFAAACSQPDARPLKPARVLPQIVEGSANVVLDEAIELSFIQLAGTPDAFTNQLVRASGTFVTLPPVTPCPDNRWPKGPQPSWALVADELQMNAVGFEQIVPLVTEGEAFIVDGVWRKFVGPVGCGKEPASQVVYYLDVVQILQPNPIMRNGTNVAAGPVAVPADNTDSLITPDGEPPDSEVPSDESGGIEPEVQQPPPGGYPAIIATSPSNSHPPATATRVLIPPTPTPSITPTPRSTTTDSGGAVVQPTRTPLPTSVPRATQTPLPTATRTPLPTSVPRVTATSQAEDITATPTDEPNDETTATATPGITITPDPDATETPTPTPTVTPDPDVTPTATSAVGSEIPTPGTPVSSGGATVTPDLTATANAGDSTPYPVPATSTPYPVPTPTPSR